MKTRALAPSLLPLLSLLGACGQEESSPGSTVAAPELTIPGSLPAPEEVDRGAVVAKVGETEITEGEVLDRLAMVISAQSGGREAPPAQVQQLRGVMGPQIVDALVDERLLDAEVVAAGIGVTEDEYKEALLGDLNTWLLFQGIPKDDFETRIGAGSEGVTLDEFVAERASEEDFRRGVRHTRLIEQKYPERTQVSEEEISERYAVDKDTIWTRPAKVRASHILFELPEGDEEGSVAQREEALRVLALARAADADFAALAKEHSEGPSGPEGGDLGFFPREGAMVEPFAAAAFELETGQVSDLVESQFGLHIIRVAERQEERVMPLEEVASAVRWRIESERISTLRPEFVEGLRPEAQIERL